MEAVEKYREVLRSVEEHKDTLHTDSLQQLHAMYNLQEILSSKPEGVDPTLRDELLPNQVLYFTVVGHNEKLHVNSLQVTCHVQCTGSPIIQTRR